MGWRRLVRLRQALRVELCQWWSWFDSDSWSCHSETAPAGASAGVLSTAAALAYGVQQGFLNAQGAAKETERVLVYDLGGGTFDVTLMEIKNSHFNTIGTAGDVYLGGIDWDHRIFDFAMKEFETKHQISFENFDN